MAYNVAYKESVEKDLKHIDLKQRKRILDAIEDDLASAPRNKGERLHGEFEGYWKYVLKPYRVIYEIFDRDETIRIVRIGHGKDVYR